MGEREEMKGERAKRESEKKRKRKKLDHVVLVCVNNLSSFRNSVGRAPRRKHRCEHHKMNCAHHISAVFCLLFHTHKLSCFPASLRLPSRPCHEGGSIQQSLALMPRKCSRSLAIMAPSLSGAVKQTKTTTPSLSCTFAQSVCVSVGECVSVCVCGRVCGRV